MGDYTQAKWEFMNNSADLPPALPMDIVSKDRLEMCEGRGLTQGCNCTAIEDPKLAEALNVTEDCTGSCVYHNGELYCQDNYQATRELILACDSSMNGQHESFGVAMRFRKRLYGDPSIEVLTPEEYDNTFRVMNQHYQGLLIRSGGLFDRRFKQMKRRGSTSGSTLSEPCFTGLHTHDAGEQLYLGKCKVPHMNGRAHAKLMECKSDKFRFAAEEACLGAAEGAPCAVNAGANITLGNGQCIRTSLGDLLCAKPEWRWIREDACDMMTPEQTCDFRARIKADTGEVHLTDYAICEKTDPLCGNHYRGVCKALPMMCQDLKRIEGVDLGIYANASNETENPFSEMQLTAQERGQDDTQPQKDCDDSTVHLGTGKSLQDTDGGSVQTRK